MGMCGPINPCPPCRSMYAEDPHYVPDEEHPGSFRVATVADQHKSPIKGITVAALPGPDRLPVPYTSKRDVRARRAAKRRRRS